MVDYAEHYEAGAKIWAQLGKRGENLSQNPVVLPVPMIKSAPILLQAVATGREPINRQFASAGSGSRREPGTLPGAQPVTRARWVERGEQGPVGARLTLAELYLPLGPAVSPNYPPQGY